MSNHRQWINWNAVQGKDGKLLKMPSALDGATGKSHAISAHEPKNWQPLDTVVSLYERGYFTGVGYVTTKDNDVVGGDVDGCVSNGVIDPQVLTLLQQFNTRTEFSPSGNGVRFWFTVQDKTALLPYLQYKRIKVSGSREIEMYGYAQFLTVTNNLVPGFPEAVNDATDALLGLYANQQNSHTHGIVQEVDWDDVPETLRSEGEVLKLASKSQQFKTLHETGRPDLAGVGVNDQGEADMSRAEFFYFSTLLEHAEDDPRMALEIYRNSALYREKASEWRNGIPYDQYSVSRTLARRLAKLDGVPALNAKADVKGLPDWPDQPTPLGQDQIEVPHLAADMLPPVFAAYVMDEAERLNVYPENVAMPLMTALSIVVGTRLAIRPKALDGWYEHPNLWGFVVAPPGSRKTDAINVGLAPLKVLVKDAERAYAEAVAQYEPMADIYKSRVKAYEAEHKKAVKNKDAEGQAQIEGEWSKLANPNPPVERRYTTQDATPEKLLDLAAENPRGLLLHRDELSGIFDNLTKSGRESERTMYLEAWSGKEGFRADRMSRQAATVEKLCLSVFGGTQLGALTPHMQNVYGGNRSADGFMQRFQLAVINKTQPPYRNDDRKPDASIKNRVTEIFSLIDQAAFVPYGAFVDDLGSNPYMRFTPEAQRVFLEWMERNDSVARALNKEGDEPLSSHFAKYNKLIPSLALLFYLVERANQPVEPTTAPYVVSLSALGYALNWYDFLTIHARAIYQLGKSRAVDETSIAARILNQFYRGVWWIQVASAQRDPEGLRFLCQRRKACATT
ncbi:DUF3987 domain-containing protein, partial [Deinococcus marmoris]|uniref:DUF3987 domain-containing protein n=1 Tax=Deinococcus marmoris TaxID=249408 RepID=UPI0039EDFF34